MTTQQTLFDDGKADKGNYSPCDWKVPDEAKPRLGRQCQAILDRLREGPVNNRDLAVNYSIKYTARISDLRKAGYVIKCKRHQFATGEAWYQLEEE